MKCLRYNAILSVSMCLSRQRKAATPSGFREEAPSIDGCYDCEQGRRAAGGKERDDDMEKLKMDRRQGYDDYKIREIREQKVIGILTVHCGNEILQFQQVGTPITQGVLTELVEKLERFREATIRVMESCPNVTE